MNKKSRKQAIPKAVRTAVWNKYIGSDKGSGLCFIGCETPIQQSNFECGHIIPEKKRGHSDDSEFKTNLWNM